MGEWMGGRDWTVCTTMLKVGMWESGKQVVMDEGRIERHVSDYSNMEKYIFKGPWNVCGEVGRRWVGLKVDNNIS